MNTSRWVRLIAFLVGLIAGINLIEAVVPKDPLVLDWMEQWLPLAISEQSRLLLLLTGVLMLALARGLLRRKHSAWLISTALLSVSLILHLIRALDWQHAITSALTLALLIWQRKEFTALSDRASVKLALRLAPAFLLALLLYAITGLRDLHLNEHIGGALDWPRTIQAAFELIFLQDTDLPNPTTERAEYFYQLVSAGALAAAGLLLALLLRPVLLRLPPPSPEELERARALIALHGDDPMNPFALLPDKRHFFTTDPPSLTSYALWRNYAIVLADPVAPAEPAARLAATRAFLHFCAIQDWEPVFYCAHETRRPIYETLGLATFKIGEDARLDVADFKLQGGKFQNLRTACNKSRKEGRSFLWYHPADTPGAKPDHGIEAQLRVISDDWLAAKKGGEMSFDLGAFDLETIRQHGAAAILNPEGRIEGFATWLPYNQGRGRSLDLMRSRRDTPGVMDFLIVETIEHFKKHGGIEEVSLGNAPLANATLSAPAPAGDLDPEPPRLTREEQAVKFLFDNFNHFYGYKSLFEFKKKYQPEWQGRHLAYRPGAPIPLVIYAIVRVHLPGGLLGLLRS